MVPIGLTERLAIVIDAVGIGAVNEFRKVGNTAKTEMAKVDAATKKSRSETGLFNGVLNKMGLSSINAGTALKVGVGVGAAAAGVAFVKMAKSGVAAFVEMTSEIRQFQRVSGATAEDSSRLVYAFNAIGTPIDVVTRGVVRLSKNIDENRDALKAHGITVATNANGQVDLTQTLYSIADAYQASTSAVDKNNIATTAFGARGSQVFLPFLARGREGIRDFFAEADAHGLVFSQEELDKAREFRLSVHNLGEAWKGVEVKIAQGVVPWLTKAAAIAASIVDRVHEGADKLPHSGDKSFFGTVGAGIQTVGDLFTAASGAMVGDMDKMNRGFDSMAGKGERAEGIISKEAFAHRRAAEAVLAHADAEKELTDAFADPDPLYGKVKSIVLGVRDAQRSLDDANHGVETSTQSLGSARQRLNDLLAKGAVDAKAVASANREVERSSRGIASAQERQAAAQEALDRLKSGDPKDRARASLTLREAQLGVAQSQQRVADAVKRLNEAQRGGSSEDIAAAQLELQSAQLGVEEATIALTDAQDGNNEANGQGEEYARKLKDAEDAVKGANQEVTDAIDAHTKAEDDLLTAQKGNVTFAKEVIDARNAVSTAEYGLATAKQAVVDKMATLKEAQDAENRLMEVGGGAALLLRLEIEKLVKLYPQLQPLLDKLNQRAVLDQYGYTGAGPPAPGYGYRSGETGGAHIGSGYKAAIDYLGGSGIQFGVSSTTGGKHAANSLHYQGKAADFVGPDLMAIARYFDRDEAELAELFYTPLGFSVKNGRRTAPIAAADHYNHVHVGTYDQGGWLQPGITVAHNLTGKPEPILTSGQWKQMQAGPPITVHVNAGWGADGEEIARAIRKELASLNNRGF